MGFCFKFTKKKKKAFYKYLQCLKRLLNIIFDSEFLTPPSAIRHRWLSSNASYLCIFILFFACIWQSRLQPQKHMPNTNLPLLATFLFLFYKEQINRYKIHLQPQLWKVYCTCNNLVCKVLHLPFYRSIYLVHILKLSNNE